MPSGMCQFIIIYYQHVSEDLLYVQTQTAVALFDDVLSRAFQEKLADVIPSRVLPVSTRPPRDLQFLLDSDLTQVDELLKAGSRKGAQAAAKLRPILAFAAAAREKAERVSEREIQNALKRRKKGEDWALILPEVAQLRLDTVGQGTPVYLRIRKDAAIAVRVAKEGEPVEGTLIKQEINIWDKFNMGRDDLAKKLGISGPRTSALIKELGIQNGPECFRTLRRKRSVFKGYSKKALDMLRKALDEGIDVDSVWEKHKSRFGARKR